MIHTQYTSKSGKLSSGHRTGKGQFSFQSQRKAVPKNVQTTVQLWSFHILARLCSKSFKLGFNSTWIKNFQMFKLDLAKAEDQRPNCQHPLYHRKSKRVPENIYFCFTDYAKTFDCVDHNKQWKILKEMGIPGIYFTCLLRNLYAGQEATVKTGNGTMDWFQIGKGVMSRLYIVTLLI